MAQMISQERLDAHHCHATGCRVHTAPEMLMCLKHWRMVPKKLQRAVWAAYREGQCEDMNPSKDWHRAADAAIGFVAWREGRPQRLCEIYALEHFGVTFADRGHFRGHGP